jgi:hypothetical protein
MIFNGTEYEGEAKIRISDDHYLLVREEDGLYDVSSTSENNRIIADKTYNLGLIEEDEVLELIWTLRQEKIRSDICLKERFKIYSKWFPGFEMYKEDYIYEGYYTWMKLISGPEGLNIVINMCGKTGSLIYERKEDSFFQVSLCCHNDKMKEPIYKLFNIDNNKKNSIGGNNFYETYGIYSCNYVNYYIVLEIIKVIKRLYDI